VYFQKSFPGTIRLNKSFFSESTDYSVYSCVMNINIEYIGATLTVKIDPLANIAQVLDGQQVVTSFAVIVDEKNQRLYQRELSHGAHAAVENTVSHPQTKEAGQGKCRCCHPLPWRI
jgi:hypothetical protein